MTNNQRTFKSLGFTGIDIRHIAVRVYPYVEVINGKLVEAFRVYTGESSGNYAAGCTTDFIFISMDKDWVFHEFQMAGKTWQGMAVFPTDGDFSASFTDTSQQAVILNDTCKKHYAHRYQIVMKNKITGALATNDPVVDNEDQQQTGGG